MECEEYELEMDLYGECGMWSVDNNKWKYSLRRVVSWCEWNVWMGVLEGRGIGCYGLKRTMQGFRGEAARCGVVSGMKWNDTKEKGNL